MGAEPSIDDLIRRMPSSLFKYSAISGQRLEWMRRLIVDSELYFTPPRFFNDPLDFKITPSFDAPSNLVEAHWRGIGERMAGTISKDEREARVQDLIRESATPEGQRHFTARLFEMLGNNSGTVCLASDPTSMLMWSYYAEGHSGIAVQFGTDLDRIGALGRALEEQGTNLYLIDVDYATEFPNCNYYTATKYDRAKVLLGTKAAAWSHEGEWRIVLPNRTGNLKVPRELITGVVLGMRISEDNERTIREWIAGRSPRIELRRVVHRPNSFQLELMPV